MLEQQTTHRLPSHQSHTIYTTGENTAKNTVKNTVKNTGNIHHAPSIPLQNHAEVQKIVIHGNYGCSIFQIRCLIVHDVVYFQAVSQSIQVNIQTEL
jgi:hypothetical protein